MLIHKRRSGQPQGAFKLRSELGFDSFLLPGVGADLVTGAPVILGSNKVLSQSAGGAMFSSLGAGSFNGVRSITNSSAFLSTTEATVLLAGKTTAFLSAGAGCFGVGSVGSAQCGGHVPYSDNKVYWDFGGNTAGTTRVVTAALTFSESDVFVFTTGPRGMEIWQNGILRASNSATPTRTTTSNQFGLGSHAYAPNDGADAFNCYAFGYSRKQMPKEICAALSRDLWGTAFVQRRRGIIATLAAAARRRIVMWG